MIAAGAEAPMGHPPPLAQDERDGGLLVNDVHARLNPTTLKRIERPRSLAALQSLVRRAVAHGETLCIAGTRHAMGGQQFRSGACLIDMTAMKRVLRFDRNAGLIEVEAGILWPDLMTYLETAQRGFTKPWSIRQKQTGADRLTIGGALAANMHGRGLTLRPFVADIESFVLVDAEGSPRTCSRRENPELFSLAVGGYGLFGVVAQVTLRLVRRQKLERRVEIITAGAAIGAFQRRIDEGCLYGDFQFSTDEASPDYLDRGILACYRPVDPATPIPAGQRALHEDDWRRLIHLAHSDRAKAYELYTAHYLATDGQIYWSDEQQSSTYIEDYHQELDRHMGATTPASEMITEVYVPRPALAEFLAQVRADFRAHHVELIYGTVRLIEADDESFLAWARQPFACIVFNLHVVHDKASLAKAAADFRRLIDRAMALGGSFYLTYHRWATARQVAACYPQFAEFLRLKRRYDPKERFQSDWYAHYKAVGETPRGQRVNDERPGP